MRGVGGLHILELYYSIGIYYFISLTMILWNTISTIALIAMYVYRNWVTWYILETWDMSSFFIYILLHRNPSNSTFARKPAQSIFYSRKQKVSLQYNEHAQLWTSKSSQNVGNFWHQYEFDVLGWIVWKRVSFPNSSRKFSVRYRNYATLSLRFLTQKLESFLAQKRKAGS